MYIKDLAKVIYKEGTASEETKLTVISFCNKNTLWSGMAKDLGSAVSQETGELLDKFIVVEVLVDWSDFTNPAPYNKNKIISVI